MNVIQALGVESSNKARFMLVSRGLCGCRVYSGRLVHIRYVHSQRPLCSDSKVVHKPSPLASWKFTDNCCRECAKLALGEAGDE